MKKRFLSLLLAAVMVTALLPTVALAADSDFVIEDGVLKEYNGPGGDVVIPDGVTRIGDEAFNAIHGGSRVTSVVIPDGVTYIGKAAFQGCNQMTSVTIPDSVIYIDDLAFNLMCLTIVNIPYTAADGTTAYTVTANETPGTLTDVYYGGTQAQWNCIGIEDGNKDLTQAAIRYGDYTPPPAVQVGGRLVTQVVPFQYADARGFSEGFAAVQIKSKWGFVDKSGKEAIPCQYDEVKDFSEGFAAVRLDNKWGFINTAGKRVVPCQYRQVESFDQGLAAVRVGDWNTGGPKWGFIDATGKEVIPCKYDDGYYTGDVAGGIPPSFHEGLTAVGLESGKDENGWSVIKYGYIDKTGAEVIPFRYELACYFSEGLAVVGLDGKCGFIDTTGKMVVPNRYMGGSAFHQGRGGVNAGYTDTSLWGVVDETGKEIVPCIYPQYGGPEFHEGLAAVSVDSGLRDELNYSICSWGYIDLTGKEVVPGKYGAAENFSEGLAAVCFGERYDGGKWGFIDKTGKEVIPCKYDSVDNFSDGLARVLLNGKYGFIDKTGKEVIPCQYACAADFDQGLAAVSVEEWRDAKWGFIDATGAEIIPRVYLNQYAPKVQEGMVAVEGRIDIGGGSYLRRWGFLSISDPSVPAANTAYASTQTVQVDGKPVTFNAYALKDANGNDTNYIKLRDVADVLSGSAAQFQVGWDGTIAITTGQMYTPNGTENIQNFTGNQTYTVSTSPVTINGVTANLEAITLTDANGGGYTYFKLRDLGAALGFNVSWSAETGITIDPNSPYDAGN